MILLLLIAVHFLCDYPLQGDFLSKAKNHTAPIPGVPWYQALLAHSAIQGLGVALVTGSAVLGLFEMLVHAVIDYEKSAGHLTFNEDQTYHILFKVTYALGLL